MAKKKSNSPKVSELPVFMPQGQAIGRHLLTEIKNGIYKPGQKLKSVRTIARQYGVGRQVALSAIQLLAKSGFVYTEKGSGTFIKRDLKKGRFGRIGLFINRINPVHAWKTIKVAEKLLHKEGFSLHLGTNFEEDFSIADWLKKKKELDGVLLEGLIDEKFLEPVAAAQIPYVVIGNYDISEGHPQASVDLKGSVRQALAKVLKASKRKNIAALMGALCLRADREAFEGVKEAIVQAGLELMPNLICPAEVDGYAELVYLLENAEPRPDFIFFMGEHLSALAKYSTNHPNFKRPQICINKLLRDRVPRSLWDISIDCSPSQEVLAGRAAKMLLKLIKQKSLTKDF